MTTPETAKPVRTSNGGSSQYVRQHLPFKASNLWAEWVQSENAEHTRYVVYSYGRHWPLFVYDKQTDTWYENASKYSVSTSRHKTQCNPCIGSYRKIGGLDMHPLHVDDMIKVAYRGPVALIAAVGEPA